MQGAQIPSDEAGIPYAAKTPVRGRSQTGGAHRRTGRKTAPRIALFDGLWDGVRTGHKKSPSASVRQKDLPGNVPRYELQTSGA